MSAKLDNSQRQLVEFSAAEEARLQELRKISQERDRAWQSELEAIQKQHSIDSAALSSAMNEIQRLKVQLEMVLKSEAVYLKQSEVARTELQDLKQDMSETLSTVENLKVQLRDSKKLEAEAHTLVDETREQLEMAKTTIKALHSEGLKLKESFSFEARVNSLEEVKNLNTNDLSEEVHYGKLSEKTRDNSMESEVRQLRSALEAVEIKYQADQIQRTMQIRSAYELMERVKSECGLKEAELELLRNIYNHSATQVVVVLQHLFATDRDDGSCSCPNWCLPNGAAVQAAVVEGEGVVQRSGREGVDGEGGAVVESVRHAHADEGHEVGVLGLHVDGLRLRPGQLRLELVHLLLELEDGAGAAVNGVPDPGIRFVHHAAHRVRPLAHRNVLRVQRPLDVSNLSRAALRSEDACDRHD
ncbi:hypothetical protein BHE74_00041056 [Ensete ventricosum]|nr:hypothetical protein BHE74_00041056 [Ensete ventricosum]